MPKRARRTGGQLGGRHCPLHDFSSSSGVTSRSYCIVCVYIYIYVCICMYAHPSTIQHIAWSGTKRRVDPTTSHHPLSLVSAPLLLFFFYLIPSRRIVCVPSFGLFHSLFPSRRLFSPQSNPSQSYRASHFQWPPKCLKLVLLFIFSLSLFFPPLSLRAEQNAICLTLLASLDDASAPVMDLQGRDFVSPVPFQ